MVNSLTMRVGEGPEGTAREGQADCLSVARQSVLLGFLSYTRYHFVAIHIDSSVLLLDGLGRWILLWLRQNNHAL